MVRMRESKKRKKERTSKIVVALRELYPEATTALQYETALQLLVATVLSAQCTDVRVNMVTPALFARYPNAMKLAKARQKKLEALIRSTGFYHNKAKNLVALAKSLVEHHQGEVPGTMEELVALPGVGRKTANVVLGNWFGVPSIAVDTHVTRLSRRLDLTDHNDPTKIEQDLVKLVPQTDWTFLSHSLILHGRSVCKARKPNCEECTIETDCPSSVARSL